MQISSEKGKLFEQSLHTGFPQLGHSFVEVCELHSEQMLFFINIISALKAKNISHVLSFGLTRRSGSKTPMIVKENIVYF
jgi:hypothetical protein